MITKTVALLLVPSIFAAAQSMATWHVLPSPPLQEIAAVAVGAVDDQPAEFRCYPRGATVRLAASRALLDARIRVSDDAPGSPTLRIAITSLDTPHECAAYVSVRLEAEALAALAHQQPTGDRMLPLLSTNHPSAVSVSAAGVILIERASLFTGPLPQFHARLIDFVRQATDEIATQIRLANQ